MVEQAVRPMVEAIVASAPSGWTHAVLHSRAGRGGTSVTGGYTPQEDQWGAGVPNPYQELMALAEALRQDHGWDPVSLEIRCRPSGEYRLVAFHDSLAWVTGMGGGFQVVLDPDHRLPQPGLHQEPGTAPPAGDPELAVARFTAARLADADATLDDALAWAARLGLDTANALRITGTLKTAGR